MPTPETQPTPEPGDASSAAPDPTLPGSVPPSRAEPRGRVAEGREGGTSDALDASLDPPPPSFTPIDTSRGRFKRNVLANLAYFVFHAGIQLWFVRYLIDNLGVATYGLVPLATNITNYMAIITVALSGSVGRFLTIDLARADIATANRTFNTSLFASIVLAMALLPAAGALSWFAPGLLDIPEGEEMGTRFLLMCTCFAFLLNAVGSNFACSTFAKNRFDVQREIDALGFITQIGVVVALFTWAEGDLWYVGAGIAASAAVRQVGYQVSWRRLTPELSIRLAHFDGTQLREILGMGGWLTVDALGWTVLLSSHLLLVNVLVGAQATGQYAPGLQVAMVVSTVAALVGGALRPTIVMRYGYGHTNEVASLVTTYARLVGLTMALPVGLVCGLSPVLLPVWLGSDFAEAAPLFCVIVAPTLVLVSVQQMFSVNVAANRVAVPSLATIAFGAANIVLAVMLVRVAGMGVNGVAAASAAVLLTRHGLFVPSYAARLLGQRMRDFACPLLVPCIACATVGATAWGLSKSLSDSLLVSLGLAFGVAAVYVPLVWRMIFTDQERQLLLRVIGRRHTGHCRRDGVAPRPW
jgi:O-antigen/teichoic acid export membrane protein